ncbi:MAG: acylneuraminate cytidylyltransferase family protein [Melioribacteraceae bacterium]|nr:acylneuraminate cytidylyltransferase family protein [Melioribacteraceae bacterium]MCF8414141.1 acylneuraminate cytidylyltransferase family protein [Melioribacteraceae bacterium]
MKNIKALLFMKHHSERVPFKNLRNFNGKPLLYWILKSLNKSEYISEIIINTDSEEIAAVAKSYFNVTIHMRPEYLLKITGNEANQIIEYDISQTKGEVFFQTHSTNPLLTTSTIDKAIKRFLEQKDHDSLFSVTKLQTRIYDENGAGINHDPLKLIKTQELPVLFEENSCIYLFSRATFNKTKNRIGKYPMLYPIDKLEAVDIDEESDFIIAENIMKAKVDNEKK